MTHFWTDTEILGKGAIDHVTRRNALRAHEGIAGSAVVAHPTHSGWVGGYHSIPRSKASDTRSQFHNCSAELVTQYNWRVAAPPAFDDVNIGPANSRCGNFDLHLIRRRGRFRPVFQLQLSLARPGFDDSFHSR